jgi:hypothetical protein
VKHTNPLEREFESWIVSGIEDYFESLGIAYSVFAVSPGVEKIWPADERLLVNSKVFGLQFKQAKLSGSGLPASAQLQWSFHQPPGQFSQVVASPEIFYCLPTFINRDYRKQALDHCLFWRPDPAKVDMNAWYNNPGARTPYAELETARRWGLFVEQLFNCTIGRRIKSSKELTNYIQELEKFRRYANEVASSPDRPCDEGLYLVAVSLES